MISLYREVGRAYNLLDVTILENILSEDICYSSQDVLTSLNGKPEVLNYLTEKFDTIKNSDSPVFAELGYMKTQEGWSVQLADVEKGDPCLILSQGSKENKGAVILLGVDSLNKITSIDICTVVPHWSLAIRTGEYPM